MAFLWWHNQVREISEALSGVGELKVVIRGTLEQHGFSNVRSNDQEVAGGKGSSWVSIAHFAIGNGRYWEVVMTAGDDGSAQAVNDEVVAALNNLHFL